jgi:hypothetical protein
MDGQRPTETQEQWEERNAKKKQKNPNLGQLHRPLTVAVQQRGQADPANPSTDGSRLKSWATPCSRDHHPNGQAKGSKTDLANQVTNWGTPTARDHKSGRGKEDRQYKELTPMVERTQAGKLNPRWVETLMGLPVGWVMPSCTSLVTVEPTNCDCSGMESCLPPQNSPSAPSSNS